MRLWIIVLCALSLLPAIQLLRYRKQLRDWARQLEETDECSNLRLSAQVRSRCALRLAQAVNSRLEKGRLAGIRQENMSRELKHTISCVSHDIRTPLTGAAGYLQLLEASDRPGRQKEYLAVVRRRLQDVEELLEELFLYTKLANEEYAIEQEAVLPYPILCDALAGFYEKITEARLEPQLQFPKEQIPVSSSRAALARIFRNLIQNAFLHGSGALVIRQAGTRISFSNQVDHPEAVEAACLFEPFYQADKARHGKGTGLGLASVKSLMEKMNGSVSAALEGDILTVNLDFKTP